MIVWRVAWHDGFGGTHTGFTLDAREFQHSLGHTDWFYVYGYGFEPDCTPGLLNHPALRWKAEVIHMFPLWAIIVLVVLAILFSIYLIRRL